MNLTDLVKAHLYGSARPGDTRALLDILDRALRSNDNGNAEARQILAILRAADGLWDCAVVAFAEQHIVTVARLEAERDAALAARNGLEQCNQELVALLHRWQRATGCVDPDTIQDTLGRLADLAECRRPVEGIPDGIDRIKRQRDSLRAKLDRFDRVVERIVEVFDLGGAPTTEDIEPLRALLLEE